MSRSDLVLEMLEAFNPDIVDSPNVSIRRTRRGVRIASSLAEYDIEIGDEVECDLDQSGVRVCVVTPELDDRQVGSLLRRLFIGDPDLHPQLSAKELRLTDPQVECLKSLEQSLMEGDSAGAIVLPTATGKTVVAAFAIDLVREVLGATTVLFLASQIELLDGAYRRFQASIPHMSLGRFYGKYAGKEDGDVILATAQSVAALKEEFNKRRFDLIIVDEFHRVMSDTYKELFKHFRPMYRLGLSATPIRGDRQVPVSAFDGNYLCYKVLKDAVLEGYVSPPDWRLIQDVTDYSGILSPKTGRKITFVSAARELIVPEREAIILNTYRRLAVGRTVGFCYSLPHALRMTQVFRAAGVQADIFTGEHSSVNGVRVKDRRETLEAFRQGRTRIIFVVDLFNEGVDVPEIETILFLRATLSPGRLLQNIGRGLRIAPGKRAVMILDFMSNYDRAEAVANLGRILDLDESVGSKRKSMGGGGAADADDKLIEMGIEIKVTEEAKRLIRETLEEIDSHRWQPQSDCYRKHYDLEMSDREIGAACGRTADSVSYWRRRNKLPPNTDRPQDDVSDCYRKHYDLGMNDREIGAACGRSFGTVKGWREDNNLPSKHWRRVSVDLKTIEKALEKMTLDEAAVEFGIGRATIVRMRAAAMSSSDITGKRRPSGKKRRHVDLEAVEKMLATNMTLADVANELGVGRATLVRLRAAARQRHD